MNNLNIKLTAICLVCAACLQSCDNKDDLFKKNEPKEGLAVLDCSSYTQWNFFSLSKGELVGSCDAGNADEYESWRNRLDWDLAFHRQDVKTNSGASGIGKGGILLGRDFGDNPVDFDAVTEAPTDGYEVDLFEENAIIYDMSKMMEGIIGYQNTGLAQPPKRWAVLVDMMNSKWEYVNKVFIVRTANGKYAKVYFKDFKSAAGASGTITMQYVYQSDGSGNLDMEKNETL
jgi:hypothetical protein